MPSDAERGIERLPGYAGNIAKSVVQAADRIFHIGLTRPVMPLETYFLNQVQFTWAFFIVKTTDARVLFFFKRRARKQELISAKVSFVFKLLPDRPATDAGLLTYQYRFPPFIRQFTTQADIDRYAPRMPSMVSPNLENTLTIALGDRNENTLSVLKPSSRFDARVRFTPEKGGPLEFKGEGEWPIVVVIQLTETLRKWAQRKFRDGTAVEFVPSYPKDGQPPDADDKNDVVHMVIEQIAKSYFKAASAMAHDNGTIFDAVSKLGVGYGVDGFEASVRMRLNKDGELSDADKDDPFYLNLDLSIARETSGPKAFVSIGPPDFLVTGENRQCFLDALKNEDRAVGKIEKQLNRIYAKKEYAQIFENNPIQISRNEIRAFIERAAQDSVVFRILHGKKKDTDVIFMKSDFDGIPFYMILCADFKKKQNGTRLDVSLVNRSMEVNYFLPAAHRRGRIKNTRVGIHLLRLLLNIHRWIEILD